MSGRTRTVLPGELAWVAAVPCAILITAAIVLLGPRIGHAFLRPNAAEALWPPGSPYAFGTPEPAKQGRVLVALLGPFTLMATLLLSGRRSLRLPGTAIRGLVATSQGLMLAAFTAVMLVQHNVLLVRHDLPRWPIFNVRTLVIAGVVAPLLLSAIASQRLRRRVARRLIDSRPRTIACFATAAALTVVWLMPAIDSEASIGNTQHADLPPWTMADAVAVLDGRTPMVNYHALYGQLWGYVAAVPMSVLGDTITIFTIAMASISALALLAIYGVLRRILHSSLLALALYLPFLATSLFMVVGPPENRSTNAQIFSVWPMRYCGPYVLAWLIARHLDGDTPRHRWLLFLVGGLVALNNLEFGLGALVASAVALALAQRPFSWRSLGRLAGAAAGGLLSAVVLVSAVALMRTGQLPNPGLLFEYPRLFAVAGWVSAPMPTVGFHLVIYATFAAALGVATVCALTRAPEPLLTGMLAWSGVFGLAAGSYYAGRSENLKLAAMLSVWQLAIVLLFIVVARRAVRSAARWPSIAALLVVFSFGLSICSLAQIPTPWSQIARLGKHAPTALYVQSDAVRFIAEQTTPGEKVGILLPLGHRIAYDLSLTDVSPYAYIQSIGTRRQMQTMINAIRQAHAHKLFVPNELTVEAHLKALEHAGFTQGASGGTASEWSDSDAG